MWRPSSFTRFWICSAPMTCRSGSTLATFMNRLSSCVSLNLNSTRPRSDLDRLVALPRHLPDQNRFLLPCGMPVGWNRKPAHPHDLIPIPNNRPKPALRLRNVSLQQQLLYLSRGLRVGWPKPVARTPVPHG